MNFVDLKIAFALRKYGRSQGNPERTLGSSVGLIIDSEEEGLRKSFLRLQEELQLEGKDLRVLKCLERGSEKDIFNAASFGLSDINWNGKIISPQVQEFLGQHFKILICFVKDGNKLASLIVSLAQSDLKIGRNHDEQKNGFDFVIDCGKDEPEIFLQELKRYIKIIKTAV